MFFHDQERRLLIYDRSVAADWGNLHGAKEINGRYVAVPQTLKNSQALRRFNLPVAPIMDRYQWPHGPGVTPWEHQKLAANFAVLHPRSFNLSDMGSGKTLSLLWATDFLMEQYPRGKCRCLIVAPLSTLFSVWAHNIFQHLLGRRTAVVLHGDAAKREKLLAQPHDYYVINPDGVGVGAQTRDGLELDGFCKILAERADIRVVVVDEASVYKDASTKRHKIARKVFGGKEYLFLLTGTPTPQAPTDAYGLAKLVNNAHGMPQRVFKMQTMEQISQFKWVPKKDGYQRARALLTPAIRFDIGDTWKDAPPLVTQVRECALTPDQTKAMKALKGSLQTLLDSGAMISAVNEAAVRTKYLQISLGAVYDEAHAAHAIDAVPRVELLKEILEQAPGKFMVLAPFTGVLEMLEKKLNLRSLILVNGNTSAKDRVDIFRHFQESENPQILLADPQVLALGLNLQRGRTAIWYGPVDKGELYQQTNKRFHRPGQKHPVNIVRIVSNPLEREIYRRLDTNAGMEGIMLDMVKQGEWS